MAPATSEAKRRLSTLLRAPDPGTPAGRKQQLGEIDELSASIKEAELVEVTRNMDARRAAQMDSWARSPGGSSRRRSSEPPEHEALRKVAHMYRSGMPNPLRLEDFSYRLSAKEALELLDLVQRSFAGGVTGDDIPRKNQLLEKACGATPGAIAQWNESMTHLNGHWVRNADVEALREAEAEFKAAEGRVIAARSKLPPDVWGPQL